MDEKREREAIAWYDRLEQDSSRETTAAFEAWRADPRNAHAFDQQMRLSERLPESRFKAERPRRAARPIAWPQLAAAGAVAAALVALWPRADPAGPDPLASPAATPMYMLTRPVRLADGSLVVLGTGARVAAEPPDARRRVRLAGGPARFIVAPDRTQPFVALAGPVSVAARDGVFDIEPTGDGPRVTVIEGDADVSRDGTDFAGAVGLASGQALDPAASAPRAVPPDRRGRLGPLEVDDMAVADVLAIAERAAGTRVLLADPATGERRITGRFDVADARRLARKLAAALDLGVEDRGGTVTLRPR